MSLDEALAVLGVERGVDHDTARRAYLRLVKIHKPERDPEGFKRVRAAWDVARRRLPREPRRRASIRVVRPADELRARPSDEVTTPPRTLRLETDPDEPDDLAPRRAPFEVGPTVWTGEHEDAAAPPDELAGFAGTVRLTAAVNRSDVDEVLELCARLLDRDADIPVQPVVNAVLLLLAEGRLDAAAAVRARLEDWMDRHGGQLRQLRGNTMAKWVLVRELESVAGLLPAHQRGLLARSVLDSEPAAPATMAAFRAFVREEPGRAAAVGKRLSEHGPSLWQLLRPAWERPGSLSFDPDPRPRAGGGCGSELGIPGCGTMLAIWALLQLMRACTEGLT